MLYSCMPFKPAVMPDEAGEIPDAYALYGEKPNPSSQWWESLGSTELNRLLDAALSDNFTLKEAWYRLQQAEALAVVAGAPLYPHLSATGTADYIRRKSDPTPDTSEGVELYEAGLVSSYELDLWGLLRSRREAARLSAHASEADLQTAGITVAAEVINRWVQMIAQQLEKQLLEKQLENNRTFLKLIELRFKNAMVSALDVYQQKQVVENIRAKIPVVEAQIQVLKHELALLLGRPPRADLGLSQSALPVIGPLPALGLPADLLANRPDVRAAGMRLHAADWQLSAARANRLPALRLSADARYIGSDLDLFFDTWLLSLAANLTAPLFEGFRLTAEVDRSRAAADENLWAYRQAVLTAVKEVENALENESRQREHIQGLKSAKAAARKGLEEAIQRYRRGLNDYLPVLTQLLVVQDLERDLIRQQEMLIHYRISLHRALGGGWIEGPGFPAAAMEDRHRG